MLITLRNTHKVSRANNAHEKKLRASDWLKTNVFSCNTGTNY